MHKSFNDIGVNDLALLLLDKEAPSPYKKAIINTSITLRSNMKVIGVGQGIQNGEENSNLFKAELKMFEGHVIGSVDCIIYGCLKNSERFTVVGDTGRGAQGDSGGGLFLEVKDASGKIVYELKGILSGTYDQSQGADTEIKYTNLSTQLSWIQGAIKHIRSAQSKGEFFP